MLTCASSALGSHILLKGMLARVAKTHGADAQRLAHDLRAESAIWSAHGLQSA